MSQGELIFVVREPPDGGYEARALGQPIFTQADSIDELREKVRGAVHTHLKPDAAPTTIRLQFVREEVLLARAVSVPAGGPPAAALRLSEDGKRLALDYFNHVETQVGLAATTAYLVLVADTILLTSFVTIFKDSAPSATWVWVAGGLLVSGMATALWAAYPHLGKTGRFFYFRTIADLKIEEYCRMFRFHDGGKTLHEELLKSVWGKSCWLKKMFERTRVAIWLTVLGTLVMLYAFFLNEKASAKPRPLPPTQQLLPLR